MIYLCCPVCEIGFVVDEPNYNVVYRDDGSILYTADCPCCGNTTNCVKVRIKDENC